MSFNVRLTGYRGLLQTKVWNPRQDGETSVYLLCQPYEFSQVVTSNGLAPVAVGPSGFTAWQDYTFFVRVEVPPFQQIYYEIQTPNRSVAPSLNSSPTAVGVSLLKWGAGWFLSFIETGISIPAAELVSETGPFLTSESGNILVVP